MEFPIEEDGLNVDDLFENEGQMPRLYTYIY